MSEVQAFGQLASTGVVGAFLVLALMALRSKDRELRDEQALRTKDAQDTMKLIMQIQQSVIDAVHKLGEIVDSWEKREEERDRRYYNGREKKP
jgi:hypothetical protein